MIIYASLLVLRSLVCVVGGFARGISLPEVHGEEVREASSYGCT